MAQAELEVLLAKVPEDCDPQKCADTMAATCKEAAATAEEMPCDECAKGFAAEGACPLWKAGAGQDVLAAKIPEGCDPEKCGEAMMSHCKDCDTCAQTFGDNGGCEESMRDD